MIYLQRKLKMKFVGPDSYLPETIKRNVWIPVMGFEIQSKIVKKREGGGDKKIEDIYYHVIGDDRKLCRIAAFNCETMVDETAEINATNLIQMLNNLTVAVKVITEHYAKNSGK